MLLSLMTVQKYKTERGKLKPEFTKLAELTSIKLIDISTLIRVDGRTHTYTLLRGRKHVLSDLIKTKYNRNIT